MHQSTACDKRPVAVVKANCNSSRWNVTQNRNTCGGIAQLGERLHGMQEVSGSIPLTSTKLLPKNYDGIFILALQPGRLLLNRLYLFDIVGVDVEWLRQF